MENFTDLGLRLGFTVPLFIAGFFVLLTLVFMVLNYRRSYTDWWVGSLFSGIIAFCIIVPVVCFSYPFDAKYLHLYRVSGEVTSVSNVLSESDGTLTRTPVLTVEGIDRDITVDDPRAVNLEGKTVDFTCTVNWNYQAADSYDCKIYDIEN